MRYIILISLFGLVAFGGLSQDAISIDSTEHQQKADQVSHDIYAQARDIAFNQNDFEGALEVIAYGVKHFPNDIQMHLFYCRLLFWSDKHRKAERQLSTFLSLHPRNYDAYKLLIDIRETMADYVTAQKVIHIALKLFPENLELEYRSGYNYYLSNHYQRSSAMLERVLERNPEHENANQILKLVQKKLNKNFFVGNYRFSFIEGKNEAFTYKTFTYGRKLQNSTVLLRLNSGKTPNISGMEYSFEIYNKLKDNFSSYFHVGFSDTEMFPKFRINTAIYKGMKNGIETSLSLSIVKTDQNNVRVFTPGITKFMNRTSFSASYNLINRSFTTEGTYRIIIKQTLKNPNNYVAISLGSFSREQTIAIGTENDLNAKYIGYASQLEITPKMLLGFSYNRNISRESISRDQLSAFIRHDF